MKKTFFELVTDVHCANEFQTLKEAQDKKELLLNGCLDNVQMGDEDRKYWQRVGAKSKIYKVEKTEIRTEIK